MATNDDLLNALRNSAISLFGLDTGDLQKSLYSTMANDLSAQQAIDEESLKNEMAQRGVLDSGVWLESLGNLKGKYASEYEEATNEATTNAYSQLLNSLLAGGQLSQIPLGNAVNWAQLNAAEDASDLAGEQSLYSGIGSLLGTLGVGQGGLLDLISNASTGISDLVSKLFKTGTEVSPVTSLTGKSGNTYTAPKTTNYQSVYTPSKTASKQYASSQKSSY